MCIRDSAGAVAVDRLLAPARSEIRKDFRRLPFDGRADRRVVHYGNTPPRAQPGQGRFQLHRFVYGLLNELLDGMFSPRPQSAAAETPAESLDAGKTNTVNFGRFTIEHDDTCVGEDLADLELLAALIVVIAKHRNHGDLDRGGELPPEHPGFVRQTIVGEVPTQQQDVSGLTYLRKKRVEGALRRLRHMQVTDGGNSQIPVG